MMAAATCFRTCCVLLTLNFLFSPLVATRVVIPTDDGSSLRILTTPGQSSSIVAALSQLSDGTVVSDISRGPRGCEDVGNITRRNKVVIVVSSNACTHIRGLIQILSFPDYFQVVTTTDSGTTITSDRMRASDVSSVIAHVKSGLLHLLTERYYDNGRIKPGDLEAKFRYKPPMLATIVITFTIVLILQIYFPTITLSPPHSQALVELQAIKQVADKPPKPRRDYLGRDPVAPKDFRKMMQLLTEFIIEYHEHPEVYNVTTKFLPGFLYKGGLPDNAPMTPEPFENIITDIYRKILPGITHWQHPRFFGYYCTGASYPDVLAEALSSIFGVAQFSWDAAPAFTELECVMVNWVGRALGLPDEFLFQGNDSEQSKGGGALQNSATDSMLIALLTARRLAMREEKAGTMKLIKLEGEEIPRVRYIAYTSVEAHNCINKVANIALVHIKSIKTDANFSMRADKLEETIKKDIKKNYKPFFVMASLGTTGICAYDNLKKIVKVAKRHGLWVHVDASYAGSFWVCPEFRGPTEGLGGADSIEINLHYAMLLSPSCSILWCRHQADVRQTMRAEAAYLRRQHANCTDFRDWSISLTRRTRSLKVWFLMRLYGVEGLRQHSRRLVRAAEHMTKLLRMDSRIEIVGKPSLGFVAFKLKMDDDKMSDEMTNQLGTYINESHRLFVTTAKPGGHEVIRLSTSFDRGLEKEAEESYNILARLIGKFLRHSYRPELSQRYTFVGAMPTRNQKRTPVSASSSDANGSMNTGANSSMVAASISAMLSMNAASSDSQGPPPEMFPPTRSSTSSAVNQPDAPPPPPPPAPDQNPEQAPAPAPTPAPAPSETPSVQPSEASSDVSRSGPPQSPSQKKKKDKQV